MATSGGIRAHLCWSGLEEEDEEEDGEERASLTPLKYLSAACKA